MFRAFLLYLSLIVGSCHLQPANADPGDYTKGTCVKAYQSNGSLFQPSIIYNRATNDTFEECKGSGWWLQTPEETEAANSGSFGIEDLDYEKTAAAFAGGFTGITVFYLIGWLFRLFRRVATDF